jgi:hypothetical protein
MTNRFLLKQFAENGDKGVFGSYQAGNKTVSSDPATLQGLPAWTNGWADAISDGSHLPAMEEFQAVQYLICKAVKELYSEGIPVWMAGETYYKGAICSYIDSEGNVALYKNITGNNGVQQPALDIINWATFSAGGGGGASAGGQMFDVVQKDHSLTFDESKGYVPLGGYAYKEGISGSRYGYPTFYETCLSEYQAGVAEQMTIGSDTITVKRNSNGHVYYDIADKSIVDTLYADTGIAWLYGIDTTSERIALPRNDYMARGEKGVVGNGMALGLTDGTVNAGLGLFQSHGLSASEANYGKNVNVSNGTELGNAYLHTYGITTDPTKSGIERVKDGSDKYLYMICGTTEEEVAMTEVTEVTTSENDTIPLFTHKYFEFKPNHISWVPANTVQSGNVYTSAYNTLVDCLTSNPYEIKVIDEADEEVGVDYSEYWIVNQTNETFRTPITVSEKALDGGIKGNGNSLGLTDSLLTAGLRANTSSTVLQAVVGGDGITLDGTSFSGNTDIGGNHLIGVSTDPTKSGIMAQEATSLLYFKVANAVQNLELIDVGRIEENKLNNNLQNVDLTSGADTIIDRQEPTSENNYTWYRLYKSGWVEQGGYFTDTSAGLSTVNFPIKMKDINYTPTGFIDAPNDTSAAYFQLTIYSRGVDNMQIVHTLGSSKTPRAFSWEVKGKADLT